MNGRVMLVWGRRLLWGLSAGVVVFPLALAASSPLQAGREFAYVIGALAGVLALSLLCVQPLLAAGLLPGPNLLQERRWHRWLGILLVSAVLMHILGLYLASPDDMMDALLLRAPTPFSLYGVVALVGVVLTAVSAALRSLLGPLLWSLIHRLLAVIVVLGSVVHALMIDGTMNNLSKIISCLFAVLATLLALYHLRSLRPASRRRRSSEHSR